jgi:hypothetical protein
MAPGLIDFGCYGANLMTWLMRGVIPLIVTAVTQAIRLVRRAGGRRGDAHPYAQRRGYWNWPDHPRRSATLRADRTDNQLGRLTVNRGFGGLNGYRSSLRLFQHPWSEVIEQD